MKKEGCVGWTLFWYRKKAVFFSFLRRLIFGVEGKRWRFCWRFFGVLDYQRKEGRKGRSTRSMEKRASESTVGRVCMTEGEKRV
jgi:hypothetical protein